TSTGPRGHSLKMRFWEAVDLQGFPIKVQIISTFGHDKIIRYKDVVLAPPDAALFKHPVHCETLAPKNLPTPPTPSPAPKKAPATPPAASPQKSSRRATQSEFASGLNANSAFSVCVRT